MCKPPDNLFGFRLRFGFNHPVCAATQGLMLLSFYVFDNDLNIRCSGWGLWVAPGSNEGQAKDSGALLSIPGSV